MLHIWINGTMHYTYLLYGFILHDQRQIGPAEPVGNTCTTIHRQKATDSLLRINKSCPKALSRLHLTSPRAVWEIGWGKLLDYLWSISVLDCAFVCQCSVSRSACANPTVLGHRRFLWVFGPNTGIGLMTSISGLLSEDFSLWVW